MGEFMDAFARALDADDEAEASSSSSSSSSSGSDDEASAAKPDEPLAPELVQMGNLIAAKVQAALRARVGSIPAGSIPEGASSEASLRSVAQLIGTAFARQLGDDGPKLRAKLRSLLFNLRDANNPDFVGDVLTGAVAPEHIPTLASEDMASRARRASREEAAAQSLKDATLLRGPSGYVDPAALSAYRALRARR
eukprot:TRINITY_DN3903_c1_g1_i1.p1 TRINITY_DN3903_c1_g1~~TRINITY_DN3903_c1_g1_i1.p1  ORF type:complete len:216 (-),score=56.18 TRINITY_DN3903_c1_g1_i1:74-658(-)